MMSGCGRIIAPRLGVSCFHEDIAIIYEASCKEKSKSLEKGFAIASPIIAQEYGMRLEEPLWSRSGRQAGIESGK
jgi:hypothetical protein